MLLRFLTPFTCFEDLDAGGGGESDGEEIVLEEPEAGAVDDNERRTWEGRLKAEQRKFDTMDAQLAPYGQRVDRESGTIVALGGTRVAPQADDSELTDEQFYEIQSDPKKFSAWAKSERQRAKEEAKREVEQNYAPISDRSVKSQLAAEIDDWKEIGADVIELAKSKGMTLADLVRFNQVEDAADMVRGKRFREGKYKAPASEPSEPAPSRADLLAAASVDSSSPSTDYSSVTLSPEEKREAKAQGMTDSQYVAFVSNPAKIKIGGKR